VFAADAVKKLNIDWADVSSVAITIKKLNVHLTQTVLNVVVGV
jgi:hypothetical protein